MDQEKVTPAVQAKRWRILEIASKIFAREGYHNTDVQVIADLAKVGKGTVYRHFGNKQELFLAAARRCLEQMAEYVNQRIGGRENLPEVISKFGTTEVLRKIATAIAEFYEKHPYAIEMMILERAEFRDQVYPSHLMFRVEHREGLDTIFREAVQHGELRGVDPIHAHNAFSDLLFGSIVTGCLEGDRANLVHRVEKAIDLLINGLASSAAKSNPAEQE